ncbi:MAG: DUF420 domain-containing protein [Leptospirales bacterium]
MMQNLPAIFSSFNALAFIFIIAAYIAIRAGNQDRHKKLMIGALGASVVFLILYLFYHYTNEAPTRYQGTGFIRFVYFTILLSHTILAVIILPMIITTVMFAAKGKLEKHKNLAKWTFPLWAYVSITGVIVYLMLYQFQ